ncbi:unnamed protein product, partial [Polarella glacialis]
LSAVANAVGAIDLKQVAATYQQEAGCSGLEAATVAAAAVGAALKAGLAGVTVNAADCAEAAVKEVRSVARKQARNAKGENFRAARIAE